MGESPFTTDEFRAIALEEGLRSCISLDKLRLRMLNEAVDWICELTGMSLLEVRREIAMNKSGQIARNLATIEAVRSLVRGTSTTK